MTEAELARYRLVNQQIAASRCKEPADVVSTLGAMQAQDYLGALWAIGLRLPAATEIDIERAIANRTIVRTWPLRTTLHFVAAADVHWLLELLGPRTISSSNLRLKHYGLDSSILTRIQKVLVKSLQGAQLTRDEVYAVLERAKISVEGQRGYHILWRMGVDRVICFGARKGKQPTFALLDEWAPPPRKLDRDTALAELSRRYFTGHGPATLQDFVWWSGLKIVEAKAGLAMVSAQLESVTIEDKVYWMTPELPKLGKKATTVHLLPGFDEYLLGYRDRSAALDPSDAPKVVPGSNGRFLSTIVVNGRVTGTWKRSLQTKSVRIDLSPFRSLTDSEMRAVEVASKQYCEFLGAAEEISENRLVPRRVIGKSVDQ